MVLFGEGSDELFAGFKDIFTISVVPVQKKCKRNVASKFHNYAYECETNGTFSAGTKTKLSIYLHWQHIHDLTILFSSQLLS